MSEGPLLSAIHKVERASSGVVSALTGLSEHLSALHNNLTAGRRSAEAVQRFVEGGGRAARIEAGVGIKRYETAMKGFRATLVRHLVDDLDLSISEASQRLHISRQLGSRLYRDAEQGANDPTP